MSADLAFEWFKYLYWQALVLSWHSWSNYCFNMEFCSNSL